MCDLREEISLINSTRKLYRYSVAVCDLTYTFQTVFLTNIASCVSRSAVDIWIRIILLQWLAGLRQHSQYNGFIYIPSPCLRFFFLQFLSPLWIFYFAFSHTFGDLNSEMVQTISGSHRSPTKVYLEDFPKRRICWWTRSVEGISLSSLKFYERSETIAID